MTTDLLSVLPHYLVKKTAHGTMLLEAKGLEHHQALLRQNNRLCILLPRLTAQFTSHAELLRRIQLEDLNGLFTQPLFVSSSAKWRS